MRIETKIVHVKIASERNITQGREGEWKKVLLGDWNDKE